MDYIEYPKKRKLVDNKVIRLFYISIFVGLFYEYYFNLFVPNPDFKLQFYSYLIAIGVFIATLPWSFRPLVNGISHKGLLYRIYFLVMIALIMVFMIRIFFLYTLPTIYTSVFGEAHFEEHNVIYKDSDTELNCDYRITNEIIKLSFNSQACVSESLFTLKDPELIFYGTKSIWGFKISKMVSKQQVLSRQAYN